MAYTHCTWGDLSIIFQQQTWEKLGWCGNYGENSSMIG